MKLSDLTSAQFKSLAKLISLKEKAAAKLQEIEEKIEALAGFSPAPKTRGRKPGSKGRRGPRKGSKPGRLKETLLKTLHAAGSEGLTIQELSDKLKTPSNNLYSWFYTTGRKVSGLKKSGKKYVYTGKVD
ncbi:MAG: hypothetical protein PW734_01785 [Verrucomicrobium sp.]|nr:hypothetical protein [Verrucomicrobium sp.]